MAQKSKAVVSCALLFQLRHHPEQSKSSLHELHYWIGVIFEKKNSSNESTNFFWKQFYFLLWKDVFSWIKIISNDEKIVKTTHMSTQAAAAAELCFELY